MNFVRLPSGRYINLAQVTAVIPTEQQHEHAASEPALDVYSPAGRQMRLTGADMLALGDWLTRISARLEVPETAVAQ